MTDFLIELLKSSTYKLFTVLLLMTSTLFTGFILIFIFNISLFKEIDFLKLIVLSISITTPILLVNIALVSLPVLSKNYRDKFKNDESFGKTVLVKATILNTLAIFAATLLILNNRDLYLFIKAMVVFEILFIILSLKDIFEAFLETFKSIKKNHIRVYGVIFYALLVVLLSVVCKIFIH